MVVGFYYRAFTVGVEYERRLSGIVARIAFPIYSRTEDPARRLALRLRIVRVNVVLVYPMLALFIALAPSLMPWLFGPQWVPAVLPAQILAVAGMASCVRNLHGPTVLAAGRPKALFVFGCAETLAYAATVWVASSHGLTLVCVAVSGFQLISLFLAYTVLLHSTVGMGGLRSSATWVQPSWPARRSCWSQWRSAAPFPTRCRCPCCSSWRVPPAARCIYSFSVPCPRRLGTTSRCSRAACFLASGGSDSACFRGGSARGRPGRPRAHQALSARRL